MAVRPTPTSSAAFDPTSAATHLDLIEHLAGIGSWEIDLATDEIRWSREQQRIHGVTEADAPRTHTAFMRMVHPLRQMSVTVCDGFIM